MKTALPLLIALSACREDICFEPESGDPVAVETDLTTFYRMFPWGDGSLIVGEADGAFAAQTFSADAAPGEVVELGEMAGYPLDITVADDGLAVLWAVDWEDTDPVHLEAQRYDSAFQPMAEATRVVQLDDYDELFDGSLAWTGDGFGLLWGQRVGVDMVLSFMALDANLSPDFPKTIIGEATWAGLQTELVFNGENLGASWVSTDQGAPWDYREFTVLSPSGVQAPEVTILDEAEGSTLPTPLWTGEGWVLPVGTTIESDGYAGGLVIANGFGPEGEPEIHRSLVGDLPEAVTDVEAAWDGDVGVIAWVSDGVLAVTPVDASLEATDCTRTLADVAASSLWSVERRGDQVRVWFFGDVDSDGALQIWDIDLGAG